MNPWSAKVVVSVKKSGSDTAGNVSMDVPSGLLETQRIPALRRYLSDPHVRDVEEAIMTYLATASSLLIRTIELKFIEPLDLATTHLTTSDAQQRFVDGRPIVSVEFGPDVAKASRSGRPDRSSKGQQLVEAIAMTVARLDLAWNTPDGQADQEAFLAANREMENLLGTVNSLFNINASHYETSASPVADYCRKHGALLLAAHYDIDNLALSRLYTGEVDRRGFDWVLSDERAMLGGLIHLAGALETQRSGETSRSDTLSRHARRNASASGFTDVGAPPRMHKSVRENLMLEKWRAIISPTFLVKASLRFGLEAAEMFPSRQYLLPLLRAAAATGKLTLRKQDVRIDNLLLAGGIVALFENAPIRDRLDDELERMSSCVRILLQSELGEPSQALSESSIICARRGQPSFFEPPF